MEKAILVPHGSTVRCGKNIDLAPNGEEKKPRVLQELQQRRTELPANSGERGGEMRAAHGLGKAICCRWAQGC